MDSRSDLYPISLSRARLRAVLGVAVSSLCAVLAAGNARAAAPAGISADRGCYLVGQTAQLSGQGFAPYRPYVVTMDGVYLGQSTTDASGNFKVPLHPGGLPAGAPQHVEHLLVSDGMTTAATTFTLTRRTGARVLTAGSDPRTLRTAFQIWGFALNGDRRAVYLHYVSPAGHPLKARALGTTGGQCGYLRTPTRRLFPFSVAAGTWTLQIDTRRLYQRRPLGPVARIVVTII